MTQSHISSAVFGENVPQLASVRLRELTHEEKEMYMCMLTSLYHALLFWLSYVSMYICQ